MSDHKQALEHRGHNSSGKLAKVWQFARTARRLLAPRDRRSWAGERHGEVEHRQVGPDQLHALRDWFEETATDIPGLDWVDINPHTRRVTFRFQPGSFNQDELVDLVERAEAAIHCPYAPFNEGSDSHPADEEPWKQRQLAAIAELAGLGLGSVLRVAPFGPAKVGTRSAMVLAIIRSVPQIRKKLDERLGLERAELSLDLTAALAQSLAQRPMTLLVLLLSRIEALRETDARRRVWSERGEILNQIPAQIPVEDAA